MIVLFALIFLVFNYAEKVNGAPQYHAQEYQFIHNPIPNAPLTTDQHGIGWGVPGTMFYLLCSDCDRGGRKKK